MEREARPGGGRALVASPKRAAASTQRTRLRTPVEMALGSWSQAWLYQTDRVWIAPYIPSGLVPGAIQTNCFKPAVTCVGSLGSIGLHLRALSVFPWEIDTCELDERFVKEYEPSS